MFKCPKCSDWFPSKYNLKRHLNKKNPCDAYKDTGLICPECCQTFTQVSSLKHHWEKKVCKDNWYFCPDNKCAVWYESSAQLEVHIMVKHPELQKKIEK